MSLLHMKIIKKKEKKRKNRLMLNIEKYKNAILNYDENNINCCVNHLNNKGICLRNCKVCKQKAIEWLLEEYKEPVLDDVEKEYLSEVIKPFRNKIATISKLHTYDNINYENNEYIYFGMKDRRGYSLPLFKQGTMYKGMQQGKHYTLQELGL